jgi:hypothetical protein
VHVHGNTVVSVVPAKETVFQITGLCSVINKVHTCMTVAVIAA